jgi:hypothetical protein
VHWCLGDAQRGRASSAWGRFRSLVPGCAFAHRTVRAGSVTSLLCVFPGLCVRSPHRSCSVAVFPSLPFCSYVYSFLFVFCFLFQLCASCAVSPLRRLCRAVLGRDWASHRLKLFIKNLLAPTTLRCMSSRACCGKSFILLPLVQEEVLRHSTGKFTVLLYSQRLKSAMTDFTCAFVAACTEFPVGSGRGIPQPRPAGFTFTSSAGAGVSLFPIHPQAAQAAPTAVIAPSSSR